MQTFEEGALRLFFPLEWSVLKYDDCQYYRGPVVRTGTDMAAVDFVVAAPQQPPVLLLIEVKDFRGHAVANRPRLLSGELAVEVLRKALDTVAALALWPRSRHPELGPFSPALLANDTDLRVVLLLEEDPTPNADDRRETRQKLKQDAQLKLRGDIAQLLINKLTPFRITSFVHSCATVPARFGWYALAAPPNG
ncbi:hypothetical protein [Hymenobacter chitinivorans]|uniref:Uncharacterized protein n=1 Tax=Hymenobacter chitinivorans DSM 11115 TaxID=1121954 RepID=A0A2M9BQ58_9BACT|nr:hypothetical protein [Hymenobacter chitinivorans]PJJ60048.1 hypothetical protein CLV45_1473 [Hymenobacter chitinivorans DSM 11115]